MIFRKKQPAPEPPPGQLRVEVFPDSIPDQSITKNGIVINTSAHGWGWLIYRGDKLIRPYEYGTHKTREEAQDAGFRKAMQLKGEHDVGRPPTNHES